MRIPKTGEFYRHFKNKLYQIVAVAEHSEDGQKLVIYQALYGEFKVYARPLEMFVSEVDHKKYPEVTQKYRFERVEPGTDAQDEVRCLQEERTGQNTKEVMTVAEAENTMVISEEAKEYESDNVSENSYEELIAEEGCPDPGLLAFLDEDSWDMKYNILVSLRDKMTDKLVDDLAVVMDVVIPEGPLDKRYEQLKICVRTRQKYENQHLR